MVHIFRVQPRTSTSSAPPPVSSLIQKFVEDNDVAGLQEILDQGTEGLFALNRVESSRDSLVVAGINALDGKGKAPLHNACELGYLLVAQELLVNGADCKVVTAPEGLNALHLLAKCSTFDGKP